MSRLNDYEPTELELLEIELNKILGVETHKQESIKEEKMRLWVERLHLRCEVAKKNGKDNAQGVKSGYVMSA